MQSAKPADTKPHTKLKNDNQNTKADNMQGVSNQDNVIDSCYTPDFISEVGRNEIFVFGSNLQGYHAGGAARIAHKQFGAVWRCGVGLHGNTYAIPTMQGGTETIQPYVDEFIEFAQSRPELTFYVTKIGCGIAGFTEKEIATLFTKALSVDNIRLPESFAKILASTRH